MNERVVTVAIGYLVIVVALLHTSLGAKPTLRVVYRLNNVDNQNAVECYNDDMLLSGVTFTFMAPDDAETEQTGPRTVMADGTSYVFTVNPSNESLVTCTLDSVTSDPVMVAGM